MKRVRGNTNTFAGVRLLFRLPVSSYVAWLTLYRETWCSCDWEFSRRTLHAGISTSLFTCVKARVGDKLELRRVKSSESWPANQCNLSTATTQFRDKPKKRGVLENFREFYFYFIKIILLYAHYEIVFLIEE